MTSKEEINKEYSQLCALLGDALFKRDVLEAQISQIKDRMKELNHAITEVRD